MPTEYTPPVFECDKIWPDNNLTKEPDMMKAEKDLCQLGFSQEGVARSHTNWRRGHQTGAFENTLGRQ